MMFNACRAINEACGLMMSCVDLQHEDAQTVELFSVYVPTNHIYVGDIFLLGKEDIIHTNLSVREGLGEPFFCCSIPSRTSWCGFQIGFRILLALWNCSSVSSHVAFALVKDGFVDRADRVLEGSAVLQADTRQ